MAKNIQVNLQFQANTTAAINNINKLNQLLTSIGTNTKFGVDSGGIAQAAQAARQLQIHLQGAINQDTGKLNLNQFNTSLRQSGLNLQQLSNQLLAAGTQGQQSFTRLATAIATADSQTISMSARMQSMMTTLTNTAKWTVASTALSSITRGFQEAITHAEDLNKALNDIRIVTGYDTDAMVKFANQARIAAKELNTTSTEYAEASLIFFQQGLTGDDVLERANVVTKLAQVTGDSMETVASQMTAVWNNFYDGSKSLEEYADILTRLGAATAASTDEIAEGLEKFAAVAETVGLSYEYATTALATVVSETRQSADVIGTAFKTLFARMQDLKLGNTLEDGTSLGTYSEALATVGVNIKDSNDNLKDMDVILDELGMRWKTLDRDQQVALAKGVAGLRQYNQFLALMSNWDEFQANLEEANEAQGELSKQAEIWQTGWEGASKRVKNNLNELYESFISDNGIADITDGLAGLVKGFTNLIDTAGGIVPLLLTVAAVFSKQLVPIVINGTRNMISNLSVIVGLADVRKVQMQQQMQLQIQEQLQTGQLTQAQAVQLKGAEALIQIKKQADSITKNATEREKQQVGALVSEYEILYNTIAKAAQKVEDMQKVNQGKKADLMRGVSVKTMTQATGQPNETTQGQQEQGPVVQRPTRMRNQTVVGTVSEGAPPTAEQVMEGTGGDTSKAESNPGFAQQLRSASAEKLGADSGSFTVDTSMDNFTKINEQIGTLESQRGQLEAFATDFDNAAKELVETDKKLAELKGTTGGSKADQKARDKQIKDLEKQRQQQVRTLKDADDGYRKLTKTMGGNEAVSKGLVDSNTDIEKTYGKVGSTINDAGEASAEMNQMMEKATTTQIGMDNAVVDATNGLNEMSSTMANQLGEATGKGIDAFVEYGDGVRDTAFATEELESDSRKLANQQETTQQKMTKFGQGAANVTATIGQVAGQAMSAVYGIQMLGQAFSDDASPMERLTSLLMGLTMLMPVVSSLTTIFTTVKNADTAATTANTIAKAFNNAVQQMGVWGIIAAVAIIGVMVAATILYTNSINKNTEATLKQNEAQSEETKSVVEASEAYREKAEVMEDLISQYNELAEKEKDLTDINKQIIEQVPEIAEKYRALIKSLKEAGEISTEQETHLKDLVNQLERASKAKDVEQIKVLKNEIDSLTSQVSYSSTKKNIESTQSSLAIKMSKIQKDKIGSDGKLTIHVGGSQGGGASNDEKDAIDILSQEGASFTKTSKTGMDLEFDTSDPKKFLEQYENLMRAKQRMDEEMTSAQLAESGTYEEVNEILEETKEAYEAAAQAIQDAQNAMMVNIQNTLDTDITEISSYSEYEKYKQEFIEQAKKRSKDIGISEEEAEKAAEAYLHAHDALSDWASADQIFEHNQAKYGAEVQEKIKASYDSLLDEEEKKLFLKIDFDKYHSDEALDAEVERLNHEAQIEEKQVKIQAIVAVEETIGDDMDFNSWMSLAQNKDIGWGEQGIGDFTSFMSLSSETQQAKLSELKATQAKEQVVEQQKLVKDLEKRISNMSDKSSIEYTNLTDELNKSKVELAIYKKLQEEAEEKSRKVQLENEQRIRDLNLEIDRYHELERAIARLDKIEKQLNDAEKQAWGADKLALMEAQGQVIESQIMAVEKRTEATKAYLELDKQALIDTVGVDKIEFGKNGEITNFTELDAQYRQRLANTDPNSIEGERLQLEFETFQSLVEKYEETMDEYQDSLVEEAAKKAEKLSHDLEAIDYAIEVQVKINERQLKILERQLKRLNDPLADGAAKIHNYTQQIDTEFENISKYENGIKDVLQAVGVSIEDIETYMSGDGTALDKYQISEETLEALEDYTDKITEANDKIWELSDNINNSIIETFKNWHEEISKVGEGFDFATEMVTNFKNIIDLVGKTRLGIDKTFLNSLNQAAVEGAKGAITASMTAMKFSKQAMDDAQRKMNEAEASGDTDSYDKYKIEFDTYKEAFQEDTLDVLSNWENALSTINDVFTENIESTFEKCSDLLAGTTHKTLESLESAFSKQQELSSLYVKDYEKIYNLSKLSRDISKSIDETDSVKSKKALRELEKEIANYQKSGKEMSQYEIDNLQKKYELRLAEIALEEAQNAKSVVKLRRDSEGNYGYVYTADEGAVEDAEQNYEDKLFEMQQANDQYLNELQSNIITNRQNMMNDLQALDATQFANAEEYAKAQADITKHYMDMETGYLAQFEIALGNNKALYETDWQKYSETTGYKISSNTQWVNSWNETVLGVQTGYSSLQSFGESFKTSIGNTETPGTLLGDTKVAWDTWQIDHDSIMQLAKEAMAEFAGGAEFDLGEEGATGSVNAFQTALLAAFSGEDGGIIPTLKDAQGNIKQVSVDASSSFIAASTKAANFNKTFSPQISACDQKVDDLNTALNTLEKQKAKTVSIKTDDLTTNTKSTLTEINKQLKEIEANKTQKITITTTYNDSTGGTNLTGEGKTFEQGNRRSFTNTSGSGKGDIKVGSNTYHWDSTTGQFFLAKTGHDGFERVGDTIYINSTATGKTTSDLFTEGNVILPKAAMINKKTIATYGDKAAPKGETYSLHFGHKNAKITDIKVLGTDGVYTQIQAVSGKLYNHTYGEKDYFSKAVWVKTADLRSLYGFDTGGYTGSWGPEGRLAMLHQKELVLNAHDTENILSAVSLIRDISQKLESRATAIQYASIIDPYLNTAPTQGDTLQQEVTIHAEFPNATDHREIEEAFENLVNLASQYANRK